VRVRVRCKGTASHLDRGVVSADRKSKVVVGCQVDARSDARGDAQLFGQRIALTVDKGEREAECESSGIQMPQRTHISCVPFDDIDMSARRRGDWAVKDVTNATIHLALEERVEGVQERSIALHELAMSAARLLVPLSIIHTRTHMHAHPPPYHTPANVSETLL